MCCMSDMKSKVERSTVRILHSERGGPNHVVRIERVHFVLLFGHVFVPHLLICTQDDVINMTSTFRLRERIFGSSNIVIPPLLGVVVLHGSILTNSDCHPHQCLIPTRRAEDVCHIMRLFMTAKALLYVASCLPYESSIYRDDMKSHLNEHVLHREICSEATTLHIRVRDQSIILHTQLTLHCFDVARGDPTLIIIIIITLFISIIYFISIMWSIFIM